MNKCGAYASIIIYVIDVSVFKKFGEAVSNTEQYRPLERGTVVAGRYEVEKYLGESLVGPTYVVRHVQTHKLVAIKFIRKEYATISDIDHIRDLIGQAKKVNHSNVVRYGKVGEFQGMVFFTQEYFPSKNLRQEMLDREARNENFSIRDVTEIATEVLKALSAIHEQDLYHTNLKPENILIRYKSADQGATVIREIKITDVMTASILGDENIKPSPYRSPECWEGGLQYRGPQSDVYSIGQVLYELLIGKPATGTYLSPTQYRDDLNEHIDTIVDIALSPNPKDRFASPAAMLQHLQTYFSDIFMVSSNDNVQKNNMPLYAGIGALVVILFAGFLFMKPSKNQGVSNMVKDKDLRDFVMSEARAVYDPEKIAQLQNKEDMLYIPGGPVLIGSLFREFELKIPESSDTLAASSEPIATSVDVPAFYIDRYEWNNPTMIDPEIPQMPIVKVSHASAEAKCAEVGKRLCTATEWEKACKGMENYVYSFGDELDVEDSEGPCPYNSDYILGANEKCSSSYGVFGMSAGPREWTSTPVETSKDRFIIKGGSKFGRPERAYRCAYFTDAKDGYADNQLSFRCCMDAE